jgi:GT2 family glycosyltransferase/glycosyltransferase involved in cell wall biosynthesis
VPDVNKESGSPPVDVIVPVYRGLSETRRCLESITAAGQHTPFELIVIDDCSPDAELRGWLAEFQGRQDLTLLANESNLGFVASVNRGMRLHPERDVVLLNSDTEVANDWLDRLRRCAYSEADIGTATPFSNNATICSYPAFCADNPLPPGLDVQHLDAVFSRVNSGKTVEIPTAVGFCMYIKRACLDHLGLFDADNFAKGYGEENDFSRRAVAAGWRNVLCADTFVYHSGGVSFSSAREALQETARKTVLRLHPDYDDVVRAFVQADPARNLRLAVDAALARPPASGEWMRDEVHPAQSQGMTLLHVTHDLGGGAIKWLKDYSRADRASTNLVLKPWSCSYAYGEGLALYADILDERPIKLWHFSSPIQATAVSHPEYQETLAEIVRDYSVDAVLISSLIGHSLDAMKSGRATVIVSHDYYPFCPAINLYFGEVCQSCDADRLMECTEFNKDFNHFLAYSGQERLAVRDAYLELVRSENIVIACPSMSVSDNCRRLDERFRDVPFVTIPHGCSEVMPFLDIKGSAAGDRLRVLVLGQMSIAKGMKLLLQAIDELTVFAEIYLVGCAEVGELFRYRPGVHVVSRYELADLPVHIRNIQPDFGLLTSICAETYSYTLTELQMMGLPPVATNIGSFPERIKHGETGLLFTPSADELVRVMRGLSEDRSILAHIRGNLSKMRFSSSEEMVAEYHHLLPQSLLSPPEVDANLVNKMQTEHALSSSRCCWRTCGRN